MTLLDRLNLRLTLLLYVVVPLLMALGAASYVALRAYEHQVEQRMEEHIELVARALQRPLSRALERDRAESVEEALASAFSINRVYSAYVYDTEGEPLAAAGGFTQSPDKGRLSALADLGARQGTYENIAGRSVYSYFVPLTDAGGRVSGLLQVTRRASDIRRSIARLRWQAGGLLLVALAVVAGLVLYGHHGAIGRHLNRLSASMARVERGDRTHRATPTGPREIASLAAALNTMLDSIAEAEHEIRQRRATQTALEEKLKRVEKLAAIGQLSAGVAHELGTPLSVIDGEAQRALRRDGLPEKLAAPLRAVRAEVRRMDRIVRQLLDFGRRQTLQRERVRADRLARMAASALQEKSARANVRLELEGPTPPPVLQVDPALLERALMNLLRNAIEAAPGGRVHLSWFDTGQEQGFIVEDDGPGISADIRQRLFEPFFTTKGVGEGTGLGLAVVHGVVEDHGGTVRVDGSPLGGARFRITLPVHPPTDAPPS